MTPAIVCFGELLLRLNAPGRELLLQSGELRVFVGGAEANVAVSLAQFGHRAAMVSIVPDNVLGAACIAELRRHGVETDGIIRTADGRLGIYFMTAGAGHRPSEIVYDRANSAFALQAGGDIDWTAELQGAGWLHLSGITPALGAQAAAATLEAARAARKLGVSVSFDCNFRAKLWAAWGGNPAETLRGIVAESDLLFADERALALLDGSTPGDPSHEGAADRFASAAAKAFRTFPSLQRIACMTRVEHDVDRHDLSAQLADRGGVRRSRRTFQLHSIVDRIGTGDAFAAGLIHGLLSARDEQDSLEFALAAACFKHSIPGDFNLVTEAEVGELLAGKGFSVRR
jgi:2-dehydro-3-deoxygluconokinase